MGADEHLFVVLRAPIELHALARGSWTIDQRFDPALLVQMVQGHTAEEFLRYAVPDKIRQLTREVLEPIVTARQQHTCFSVLGVDHTEADPFLATAAGRMLAGRYARQSQAEVWLLPGDVPDIVPWVRAALAEWHQLDPDRFPGVPDWSHEPHWQTRDERQKVAALSTVEAERLHITAHLDQRAASLHNRLDAARGRADLYERALLTADSDELVEAVIRALRELGFTVVNADDHATPGDNLEDLHISDPDHSAWLAIAEVKGYTKGASTAAFQQLARFNKRYLQRTGASPAAEWYIANQFRKQDPSVRQPMLHGKSEDIRTFAEDGGLIIDTVTLFRVLEQVRAGTITGADVRTHLRSATGVLTPPPW
ncbi:hypothetical protein [Kribbella sp. NPDC049227]|uniref:hypothetical protein n=1 Tax=Kribbella sp. NPDC049227 TaxID=3364113 RepID=UPI00372489B5